MIAKRCFHATTAAHIRVSRLTCIVYEIPSECTEDQVMKMFAKWKPVSVLKPPPYNMTRFNKINQEKSADDSTSARRLKPTIIKFPNADQCKKALEKVACNSTTLKFHPFQQKTLYLKDYDPKVTNRGKITEMFKKFEGVAIRAPDFSNREENFMLLSFDNEETVKELIDFFKKKENRLEVSDPPVAIREAPLSKLAVKTGIE